MAGTELVTLERDFNALSSDFSEVLAGIMPVERLIRTVIVSVEKTPKLLECSRQSILNSAMSAAVLGLEVDGATGQAFLIPFAGKAQLVIGYKGFNTLGARAGLTISGDIVREGDDFDYDTGEAFVRHKPSLAPSVNRRMIASWAKAAANDRPPLVAVMGIEDILAVKARSPGAKKPDSPWNDPIIGFPAMGSKTVKRRLSRSTPLTVFSLGAALDETVEERGKVAWIGKDRQLRVEGEGIVPREPAPTPTASELMAKKGPTEIIEELEEIARTKGVDALKQAWTMLPHSVQQTLGVAERDRLKEIATKASAAT